MPTESRSNDAAGWIACDDGLHLIQMDKNLSHYGWVFRKVDGGLPYSVREATSHEMAHAQARQHLRIGVALIDGQAPAPQPHPEPASYPPCDYCGTLPSYHPWHGSGMLNGVENRHIHACDGCRGQLPSHPGQPHPEPIAWMVGTAFWWTKEEAERDAVATGLPIVGLGPMTGFPPVEQHQVDPVGTLLIEEYFDNREVGEVDVQLDSKVCQQLAEKYPGQSLPLYTNADHGEVERLKSIERSYGLREALLEQVKGERDRMIARTMELSGQLANQDALLHKLKETLQREYWDEYAGLDETRELIDAALSASQEPSTPAAPYPNRLCHIDYTAHPYRCGGLKGDEEAQRRYDEHCRRVSAKPGAAATGGE